MAVTNAKIPMQKNTDFKTMKKQCQLLVEIGAHSQMFTG